MPAPIQVPDGPLSAGRVRWYDTERKFGWVRSDDGADYFVHWRCLKRWGVNPGDMLDDARVLFTAQAVPGRSPEVAYLRFAAVEVAHG